MANVLWFLCDSNKYILVVSDYFTKWTESFPTSNIDADIMNKLNVDDVIVKIKTFKRIHSYQGRQFEYECFSEVCKLLNI